MIPLAIVGVGGYGGELIRELEAVEQAYGCRLIAAADARLHALPERAAHLRARGTRLYDDALEMLEDLRGRCEAVYIAAGIPSHASLTVAAARCGYHVHLEKPPAATVQEVDAMLGALREADRMCLVGFQALHGDMRLALDRLAGGGLGAVRSATCVAGWPRPRSYYRRNDWAGRLRSGENWVLDGPATNALAHQLAHMLAMASGETGRFAVPVSVRAELYAAGPVESHNVAAIEVRTAGGAVIRFFCSHATDGHFDPVIRVAAERGSAVYAQREGTAVTYDDGASEFRACEPVEHREMIANFIEALRRGDAAGLRCRLAETRNFVLALDGAHESSGRIHRIDEKYWHVERVGAGDRRVVVPGLDELLRESGESGQLLSDLPDAPPWAVATEPFDLTDYADFPRRFDCRRGGAPEWP